MNEEWIEWRFCKPCKEITDHIEHDVKHDFIPYTCKECGAKTALLGYDDDGEERVEEMSDG